MIISAQIISMSRNWYTVRPCAQIAFALGQNDTLAAYPQCIDYFNGNNPNLPVIVTADFASSNSMELSAALGIPFGAAGWLALLIHTFAIECYVSWHKSPPQSTPRIRGKEAKRLMSTAQLKLTPKESNRLRQKSYERQLERGMSRPGYAGLSVERFGDAEPFQPEVKIVDSQEEEAAKV
jgi:hypothetical protein